MCIPCVPVVSTIAVRIMRTPAGLGVTVGILVLVGQLLAVLLVPHGHSLASCRRYGTAQKLLRLHPGGGGTGEIFGSIFNTLNVSFHHRRR